MAAQGGKDFLLKVGDGAMSEAFATVGGLRNTKLTVDNAAIDVTNQESSQWQEILAGAGIKKVKVSGTGVFTDDATIARLNADILGSVHRNYQVIEVGSGKKFAGAFKITSFERSGDYNNEQSWSISLESSGAVTYS